MDSRFHLSHDSFDDEICGAQTSKPNSVGFVSPTVSLIYPIEKEREIHAGNGQQDKLLDHPNWLAPYVPTLPELTAVVIRRRGSSRSGQIKVAIDGRNNGDRYDSKRGPPKSESLAGAAPGIILPVATVGLPAMIP